MLKHHREPLVLKITAIFSWHQDAKRCLLSPQNYRNCKIKSMSIYADKSATASTRYAVPFKVPATAGRHKLPTARLDGRPSEKNFPRPEAVA